MRQWLLLILVVLVGIGYLTVSDNWQVYEEPLYEVREWWNAERMSFLGRNNTIEAEADEATAEEARITEPMTSELTAEEAGDSEEDIVDISEASVTDAAEDAAAVSNENSTEGREVSEEKQEEMITRRKPEEVEYLSVEDDYFADAVFIGDSRTVGMCEYAGLEDISTFYASTGLTIYKLFDAPIVEAAGQKQKKTVEEALSENTFSKIYLMIGINEMGTGTVDSFMETYTQAVEHLRELQPDAVIYLQGIMKVTTERSEKGDYITNEGIEERNERIAKLADYVNIYYLDVNPLICDETGGMEASYTYDGVHLKARYISIWKDYLKSHAVDNFHLTDNL